MKKIISIVVSLLILTLLYSFLDIDTLYRTLAKTNLVALLISAGLLVVLVLASGLRLSLLGAFAGHPIPPAKAIEATFAASTLNIFLPGKLGDLLKASLLAKDDPDSLTTAVGLVVWEKLADLATLFLLGSISLAFAATNIGAAFTMGVLATACIGILISRHIATIFHGIGARVIGNRSKFLNRLFNDWGELLAQLGTQRLQLPLLLGFTLVIWAGHILQICLMAYALGVTGEIAFWAKLAGLIPVAIVAGLIPLTFAGVGTRDAALVVLLGGLIGAEAAAALGILFWLRYLIPGTLGVRFLPEFLRTVLDQTKNARRTGM